MMVLLCFISLLAGGFVVGRKIIQEKGEVSAHPTNSITLDENGSNEFPIPIDGSGLLEQELVDLTPQFDDYVQGDSIMPNTTKSNVTAYGSNNIFSDNDNMSRSVTWSINDVKETLAGNYIVLFGIGGQNRGGLIKIALFNPEGELLATTDPITNPNDLGNLENNILRVGTGFYGSENNTFLFGTSGSRYFKCTVENESNSNPTIVVTELNTEADSNGDTNSAKQLRTHELFIIRDFGSQISNRFPVTGPIYPSQPKNKREGVIPGRLPIGAFDSTNWLSGNLPANVNHEYSLENVTVAELGYATGSGERIVPNLYMNTDMIYGRITYDDAIYSKYCETVQIFSKNETVGGDNLKKRKYFYRNNSERSTKITILNHISDDDNVYFLSNLDAEGTKPARVELIKVNLHTFSDEILRTFPADTNLLITPNSDGTLSYYGSTTELSGEFESAYYSPILNSPYYYVQGVMAGLSTTEPASVINLRALELSNWLNPTQVVNIDSNKLFICGRMSDYQTFPDDIFLVEADGQEIASSIPQNAGAFVGIINLLDDYSPAVSYGSQSISVNIDDKAITAPSPTSYRDWNTLDRWLITGTKNGQMGDEAAIKVYDHFDSNDPSIGTTAQAREEWLQKRINRNPKAISTAIDWEKLGFDASKAGPQLVTYFVTDTQSQPSVTSRWVNKKTSQTIEEDDYLFDAQNFHIPLTGIESAIPAATKVEKFKELAKTMAWNTANQTTTSGDYGGGLDEDGASKDTSSNQNRLSNKVTVNETQLEALRAAKTAKPYPVDVTYKPENGVEIVNRVWVFVTTKNTLPNNEGIYPTVTPAQTNGVVYYADDYSLPFRLRGDHEEQDVLERGNVRVYDYYDASHETDSELPVLADKNTHPEKLQVETNGLATIQQASLPGKIEFGIQSPKIPLIRYEWDGSVDANHQAGSNSPTYGGLDVTLKGDALLHVRQVVLTPSDKLVLPQDGYAKIENRKFEHGSPVIDPNYQGNITMNTQGQADSLQFTDIVVSVDHLSSDSDEILLSLIVPEHYSYVGYYLSHGVWDSNGQSHSQGHQNPSPGLLAIDKGGIISEHENGEYFITFYIKPNEETAGTAKTPQPYSWSYKHNNLGEIKTK